MIRSFRPDVRGIHTAGDGEPGGYQPFPDHPGIFPVKGQRLLHLTLSLRRVDRLGPPLGHVGHPVEFGALAAVPKAVQRYPVPLQLLRDHGVGTSGPRKTGRFRKGAELHCAASCPFDLKNRVGNAGRCYKSLIGRVEEDDRPHTVGVIHPGLQLFPGGNGAGGVVGKTQVDEIHLCRGDLRGKLVFRSTGHIDKLRPLPRLGVILPRPAGHGVGVHIDRIYRVTHRHHIVHRENVHDVAAVALGAI